MGGMLLFPKPIDSFPSPSINFFQPPLIRSDWEAREVTLTVRDGGSGEAAVGVDGSTQEVTFSLDTCLPSR